MIMTRVTKTVQHVNSMSSLNTYPDFLCVVFKISTWSRYTVHTSYISWSSKQHYQSQCFLGTSILTYSSAGQHLQFYALPVMFTRPVNIYLMMTNLIFPFSQKMSGHFQIHRLLLTNYSGSLDSHGNDYSQFGHFLDIVMNFCSSL